MTPNDPPAARPAAAPPKKPAPAPSAEEAKAFDDVRERFELELSDDGEHMHITCRERGCASGRWVFPLGERPKDRAAIFAKKMPVVRQLGAHADAHDAKAKTAS